ncbi:hypothetical protein LXA43DRAFT_1153862 [Ganoderma leucocontextum]|nr:hypothetical protein LXA43DRAFT_1153862 [Ganoderma leucocontextum]
MGKERNKTKDKKDKQGRDATPRPKGPRGNHALLVGSLPSTPKNKKRKRVDSDDESDPRTRQKAKSSGVDAPTPQRDRAKPFDRQAPDVPDSAEAVSSGNTGQRSNRDHDHNYDYRPASPPPSSRPRFPSRALPLSQPPAPPYQASSLPTDHREAARHRDAGPHRDADCRRNTDPYHNTDLHDHTDLHRDANRHPGADRHPDDARYRNGTRPPNNARYRDDTRPPDDTRHRDDARPPNNARYRDDARPPDAARHRDADLHRDMDRRTSSDRHRDADRRPPPDRRPSSSNHASSSAAGPSSSNRGPSRNAAPTSAPMFDETFAALKAFVGNDQDTNDVDLVEQAPKRKAKRGKMVLEQDDEEEEEEEEEAEEEGSSSSDDDDDGYANDGDNLSTEAVDELMRVIRLSKKKKYSLSKKRSNSDKPPGHFQKWGRHAHRLCGVYTDIYNTITTGMTVIGADPKTAEDYQTCFEAVPSMSAATAKFYTKKFLHLVEQVPKFKSLCGHLLSRPGDMFVFARFFAKHAAAGRSTDLSTIKRNFHDYLPTVTVPSGEVIAPLTHAQAILKSRNGGYWSQCTGRLVVPIEERDAYDEDPRGYCRSQISRHKSDAIDEQCQCRKCIREGGPPLRRYICMARMYPRAQCRKQ